MIIRCNFSRNAYPRKPCGGEIAQVQEELDTPDFIDTRELADLLTSGCNTRLTACNGTCDRDFISGQLLGADFDNASPHPDTPETVTATLAAANLRPLFAYYTWSDRGSGSDVRRFRVVLALDKPIEDGDEYRVAQKYIVSLFDPQNVDTSCTNPARLFFGTGNKELIFSDFTATNSTDSILSRCAIERRTQPRERGTRHKRIRHSVGASVDESVLDAIRWHDADYLRARYDGEPQEFDNTSDFFSYLYTQISLADFLGVPERTNIPCIFHEDGSHNSASVFQSEPHDYWMYHCFSDKCEYGNRSLTIKQVCEAIADFHSEYRVIEFLKSVFRLSIKQSSWATEQLSNIASIRQAFNNVSPVSFDELCPTASANCRYSRNVFNAILSLAEQTISPYRESEDDSIIFSMSVRQITKAAGCSSISKASAYLKQLEYHGLLIQLSDDEVPPNMLNKARQQQMKSGTQKHIQFFSIPSWVVQTIRGIESAGIRWKQNGYRLKHLSFEEFYRTEGYAVASFLYPQHGTVTTKSGKKVKRTVSAASEERHTQLLMLINDLVDEKGYTTEREILDALGNKAITAAQLQRSLVDIMDCSELQKIPCNKKIKEQFGITCKGYPRIICRR